MAVDKQAYLSLRNELDPKNILLVAVSKTKSADEIKELYDLGHRDFAENYVQELLEKQQKLPSDIRWHFIGHLQTNKVKLIVPFIHLIQAVDSAKLLKEIDKQALKINRTISVLLQLFIATEETKFGFSRVEFEEILSQLDQYKNVKVEGLMGMASFTEDTKKIRAEFQQVKLLSQRLPSPSISMGMTSDYKIAIEEGSTMVRIGSLLFGSRN